jgi:hypothetical protein
MDFPRARVPFVSSGKKRKSMAQFVKRADQFYFDGTTFLLPYVTVPLPHPQ